MTDIYASMVLAHQDDIWTSIEETGVAYFYALAVTWGFNQIPNHDDKREGAKFRIQPARWLREALENCDMVDLGYTSP